MVQTIEWLGYFIILIHTGYWLLVSSFIYFWYKIPSFQNTGEGNPIYFSVVIPVRDEAKNILKLLADLQVQTHLSFEVIIIDDRSEDDTFSLVSSFISKAHFPLRIETNQLRFPSPKKSAIVQGIELAKGQFIVTTDGDCRVQESWLAHLSEFIQQKQAKLVSGGVVFESNHLFGKMQTVEMMSLIGAGAASLAAGSPSMCNGANLAFEKKTFFEVGGYAGNEHLASGDDEFLLHKIHKKHPYNVFFLKDKASAVSTAPLKSLQDFFHQRKRWAGKWSHYTSLAPKLLAIFIFTYHFSFIFLLAAPFFGLLSWNFSLSLIAIKLVLEFIYLGSLLLFYGKQKLSHLIFPLGMIYSFYAVIVGISSNFGGYTWKKRRF
ncbi:glycosyltransferase [Flammeovirgaceae bacterium SG7u.111]|nr:glycosyltransferase [Flammeovirgaceae bacterium SG7u.132]WPO34159.1 glycosyltransferase [Flammeovirgaceae bacterium SG7u.111]